MAGFFALLDSHLVSLWTWLEMTIASVRSDRGAGRLFLTRSATKMVKATVIVGSNERLFKPSSGVSLYDGIQLS